jgi:hypothetical protein
MIRNQKGKMRAAEHPMDRCLLHRRLNTPAHSRVPNLEIAQSECTQYKRPTTQTSPGGWDVRAQTQAKKKEILLCNNAEQKTMKTYI